ncbi:lantibiotic dehydratase [Pseudofrankia sp. BMG5.37]|uniref:lantibiotic dehydratase n=1 Tax=Pseudofrankia sp. BMG5.37 TaxID=3050035 RepID=UPI0028941A18|nr:lantibiotic dehydratase [Pseudofrankia sp. BMG5.37]MDT3444482.1 lantibiotic dehydratase [Pseudofrankia sp. BMG5.37]
MASRTPVRYRSCGAALLRASTWPDGLDFPAGLRLPRDADGCDGVEPGWAWLTTTWRREDVRAAVGYASPALAGRLDELAAAGGGDERTARQAALSLVSYLLRWQRRATPFGLFAGVAPARLSPRGTVRWGDAHRVAARADAAWLAGVLTRLRAYPRLVERLPVVLTDVGQVRGNRFAALGVSPDGATDELAPVEVSVRLSGPVRTVLRAARKPVPFAALRDQVHSEFPAASAAQVDGLLLALRDQGILIDSLSAPMTCPDALGHACAALAAVDARDLDEVAELVDELTDVHAELSASGSGGGPEPATVSRMRALSTAEAGPLLVDVALDCDVQIPRQVVDEAAEAVRVLLRLSPYPYGQLAWRDLHGRFRARYGTGALVPVLELVADSGLGLPGDYLGSARGRPVRQLSERDEKLLELVQRAAVDGAGEIVLTRQLVDELAGSDPADGDLPDRLEVAVEIRAGSVEALTRGRFELAVTGTPRPGSSMAGRHAHLLPTADCALLAATFTATEPGTVATQLSFAPRKQRNDNLARTVQLLPDTIGLGEHRTSGSGQIGVADLAVTADERRFYLVERSTGRRVEPRVTHALEATVHTPPLARFLSEIATARTPVYQSFHFGAAARLPYLPRVRYRRTVLAPARWLLATGDLPSRASSTDDWEAALDVWRARWRVPAHVAIVELDRRQPVDLDQPVHRLLLRTRLERAGQVELRETSSLDDVAWLGRAHELLLPLVLDSPQAAGHARQATDPSTAVAGAVAYLPGSSDILCAQLYGHPARTDELLTEHLTGLLNLLGDDVSGWWFRRHRPLRHPAADQYLAVYLRLPAPSAYGAAAEQVAAWVDGLRNVRLVSHHELVTYQAQHGRYGFGTAMDRAHDVFAADSAAVLAQIGLASRVGLPAQAVTAASLVDLIAGFTGTAGDGLDWLVHAHRQEHGPLSPDLRDHTFRLADPHRTGEALRALPGGVQVLAAWQARADTLAAYRHALAGQHDPLTVLPCLLRQHHNRALGVDPAAERVTVRLARAAALRHLTTTHRLG